MSLPDRWYGVFQHHQITISKTMVSIVSCVIGLCMMPPKPVAQGVSAQKAGTAIQQEISGQAHHTDP
eukprot:1159303-Pelagomonas_calceolata.AAC.7